MIFTTNGDINMKEKRTIQKTCYFGFPVILALESYMTENKISNFNVALNRFLEETFSNEKSQKELLEKLEEIHAVTKETQAFLKEKVE
ncbi:hypothetical protein SIO92_002891 [Burkholderia cenocepacia]|nr:hypothetical protein [Burkholderia cenocepacia]